MPKIYVIAQVVTEEAGPLSEAAAANLIQQAIGEHADQEPEPSLVEEVLEVVIDVLSSHARPKEIVKDLRKLLKIE